MKKRLIGLILIACLFTMTRAETGIALKMGKIFTPTQVIKNGVILIKGNKIERVTAGTSIPAGYKIHDYSRCYAYPGIINAMTSLGMSGISMVREWNDTRETGKYNPHISAFTAFYPWSNLIPNARDFGTLTALTAPGGGIISGKAVLVNLNGWIPEDMFIKKEAALIINLPESPRRRRRQAQQKKPDFSKEKKALKKFLKDAQIYFQKREKNIAVEYCKKCEAMAVVWAEKLPVIIKANTAKDIKFAIQLGKDFNLQVILYGVYEGEKALKEIKASGYPVILPSMYGTNRKWEDGCDIVFRLPGALEKHGIKFAFSTYSSSTAFDLPIEAARAVAYGLSQGTAIKALTQYPADMLGIAEYGSLASGKMANIVVTNGNILETSTVVKEIWMAGKPVKAKSFFTREYERAREKVSGEMK
jgi:imidazolonepropionase-like amidohydrolase